MKHEKIEVRGEDMRYTLVRELVTKTRTLGPSTCESPAAAAGASTLLPAASFDFDTLDDASDPPAPPAAFAFAPAAALAGLDGAAAFEPPAAAA